MVVWGTMNTNEAVTVFIRAIINAPEANAMIRSVALDVLAGAAIPEEIADIFSMEVITRPSGSKYVVVDFA